MRNITTFKRANQALDSFISTPVEPRLYTLDRMRQLMNYLGNPQNKLKIIHVAGTSGKTSTAYFIASLLQSAGFSTGLTVSPHVDEINERAQLNMRSLGEQEYCLELSQFLDIVDSSRLSLTYLEVLVAFSFWLFNKKGVDYAVIEVGRGGLVDCTNVIDRTDKVCVITDIGLDHTAILGKTIKEIAMQKAGIIQQKNEVFVNQQADSVMKATGDRCRAVQAVLHVASGEQKLADLPLFQKRNFKLAYETAGCVLARDANISLSDEVVEEAAKIYIPARMEVVDFNQKTLIVDGSHNEQKINALVESVIDRFPDSQITLLVCFGRNKQSSVAKSMKMLSRLSTKIILTSFGDSQIGVGSSMDPTEMSTLAKKAGFRTVVIEPMPEDAFSLLMDDEAPIGLITGSFYSLNNFRPIIANK